MNKRRGRPKSSATLEAERVEKMLMERPGHITPMSDEQKEKVEIWIQSAETARLDVIRFHNNSQTTPDSHAYEMESLSDEFMTQEQTQKVLQRDATYRENAEKYRELGGYATKNDAAKRAAELCQKNRILLERMKPYGPLSASDVSKRIINEWLEIPPGTRLPGETQSLRARGVGGPAPNERTVRNYIKIASPHPHQRVGKGSLRKK